MTDQAATSLVIMGGGGHVGLPLGIAFASRGLDTTLFDIDAATVDTINRGVLPFLEEGAGPILEQALADGLLRATTDPASICFTSTGRSNMPATTAPPTSLASAPSSTP